MGFKVVFKVICSGNDLNIRPGTTSATIANTAIKDNTDLTEATGSTTGTAAHASPTAIHNIRETAGGWYDQIDAIIN